MKKDIFHGKIKKEYFSYILVYMIFITLLIAAIGLLFIYGVIWEMEPNSMGERIVIGAIGISIFLLAPVFLFLELFAIRQYPKYPQLRRALFNSDCYFTDSTSNEYFGESRTIRGRRNKAAFAVVTTFAEAEKRMGNKKPVRYTVYCALMLVTSVLGLANLFVMPLLFERGIIFPNMSDGEFALLCIAISFVLVGFAIFFFIGAFKAAMKASWEDAKWISELYCALTDISVRQNHKKQKFWYEEDQLKQIKNLVKYASQYAVLKLEKKRDKLVSFKVINTWNHRVIFTGMFI